MKKFKRILVANRGEIALRVIRACKELGIRSVAIYSEEDKNALFRTKADESYQIGKGKSPLEAYLGISQIIELAKAKSVDAIHPGYGFLSENRDFAAQCEAAGIAFIGPTAEMMGRVGDKIQSKLVAHRAGVATVPGVDEAIKSEQDAIEFARFCGYPVMLKASAGGGGRGMRIVREEKDLLAEFNNAQSEARKAFGVDDIFIEKYIESPKHIEVQVLGDECGNLVHLYERDCSVQRRHQKVIEFTPSQILTQEQREAICEDALKIAREVNYRSAGTVEFLMDNQGNHYFIEMNTRIQVEHTVTEMVTGVDLVQSQILVAEGYALDSPEIGIRSQQDISMRGAAIQCRITTEDPVNGFAPDTGKIDIYRTGSGFGIRLDGDSGFTGAVISPYYDSLLVKITSWGRNFQDARTKAYRALSETVVEGVKTNIRFLQNVLNHPTFVAGECDTNFIGEHPELMHINQGETEELRVLKFLGNKYVNEVKGNKPQFDVPTFPRIKDEEIQSLSGTRQLLQQMGPEKFSKWILDQKRLLITDTTMRDAHQSLMATRMRTVDMEKIAPAVAYYGRDLFSLEMWGGATFDVAYRFLEESPWERLATLREKIPNLLFQMLFRGANAVGYKNYPDNVIRAFIRESVQAGIDVFRIFDSLNWVQGMEVALDEVLKQGKIAEACICYTGDILDESKEKYNLKYYVELAKELERRGAHILAIKDMSSLLKPLAAHKLITALKNELSIPVHLHTHDTSGNGGATLMMAAMAGADVVDAAFSSMAGLTSQPSLNSLVAALENSNRDTQLPLEGLDEISAYWEAVRPVYKQFESDLKTGTTEIYYYEMPGGQYSNFKSQVESFGLGHRFQEVKSMYKKVNLMLGDIVKVTPSSKVVGDLAIFMVQNDLTPENIVERGKALAFPDSVVSYFKGMMGQPAWGFPEDLQKVVLKGEEPITCRPGKLLPPVDFDQLEQEVRKFRNDPERKDLISYAMYPKVYEDFCRHRKEYGYITRMGSHVFFNGMALGETNKINIEDGKTLVIKYLGLGDHNDDGTINVQFELNGMRREVAVRDPNASEKTRQVVQADESDPRQVGASIPGMVSKLHVQPGDTVEENQVLMTIEAMKMETAVTARTAGKVREIRVKEGQAVKAKELLMLLD